MFSSIFSSFNNVFVDALSFVPMPNCVTHTTAPELELEPKLSVKESLMQTTSVEQAVFDQYFDAPGRTIVLEGAWMHSERPFDNFIPATLTGTKVGDLIKAQTDHGRALIKITEHGNVIVYERGGQYLVNGPLIYFEQGLLKRKLKGEFSAKVVAELGPPEEQEGELLIEGIEEVTFSWHFNEIESKVRYNPTWRKGKREFDSLVSVRLPGSTPNRLLKTEVDGVRIIIKETAHGNIVVYEKAGEFLVNGPESFFRSGQLKRKLKGSYNVKSIIDLNVPEGDVIEH